MNARNFHIFVCSGCGENRGGAGWARGLCDGTLLDYVAEEVQERGLPADVSPAGCCQGFTETGQDGAVMLVHPNGWWYAGLDTDKVDTILDALQEERPVTEYLVNRSPPGMSRFQ